jgi:DNA-binding MarR family transcriptional regulator
MGQHEVYMIFKNSPKDWLSSKHVSDMLLMKRGTISTSIKKLRRIEFIYRKYVMEDGRKVAYYKLVPKGRHIRFSWRNDDRLSNTHGHKYHI